MEDINCKRWSLFRDPHIYLKWFERNGISTTLCNGMLSAQEKLSEPEPFDVVLSDLRLPDGDGIMLLV